MWWPQEAGPLPLVSLAQEMRWVIDGDPSMVSPFFRIVRALGTYPSVSVSLPIFLPMSAFCSSTRPFFCPHPSAHLPSCPPMCHPFKHICHLHIIHSSLPFFFIVSIRPFIPILLPTLIQLPTLPLTSHAAVHPSVHLHQPVNCSLCPSVPFDLSRFIQTPVLHPATFLVTQLCHTLSVHVYHLSIHHPPTRPLPMSFISFSIHPSIQVP